MRIVLQFCRCSFDPCKHPTYFVIDNRFVEDAFRSLCPNDQILVFRCALEKVHQLVRAYQTYLLASSSLRLDHEYLEKIVQAVMYAQKKLLPYFKGRGLQEPS